MVGGGACLDGTVVTTSFFDNGGGSWTIEVCVDGTTAGCEVSHIVLTVPPTAASITVTGCSVADGYGAGACAFAIGDAYKIDIDQGGACSGALRCVSVTLTGVTGVNPTGGTIGVKGGQDCQTVDNMAGFMP